MHIIIHPFIALRDFERAIVILASQLNILLIFIKKKYVNYVTRCSGMVFQTDTGFYIHAKAVGNCIKL